MTVTLALVATAAALSLSHWATWTLADHRGSCRGWAERGRLDGRYIDGLIANNYQMQAWIGQLEADLRAAPEPAGAGAVAAEVNS
jgi:hypothetical protein